MDQVVCQSMLNCTGQSACCPRRRGDDLVLTLILVQLGRLDGDGAHWFDIDFGTFVEQGVAGI